MSKREILDRLEDIYKKVENLKYNKDYRERTFYIDEISHLVRLLMDDIR
jgi:hypothetical protein